MNLLKGEKDLEVWSRLLKDLNTNHGVSNKQIMKQFDSMYSKWFSNGVDLKELRKAFEVEVAKSESQRFRHDDF